MSFFKVRRRAATLFSYSALLFAVACSESGGGFTPPSSSPPPPPPPPPSSGPTWTPGVYLPASQFKDLCQVVRVGVDIEGNPFPDMPGSTLEENFWLRSWTNETYLWNDEVTDQNPALFNVAFPVTRRSRCCSALNWVEIPQYTFPLKCRQVVPGKTKSWKCGLGRRGRNTLQHRRDGISTRSTSGDVRSG